ncbi:hypothetical protein MC7420_4507 [Coleofasciculus chthonoplastes PCC 7420]|uniref:Uncharacterized protein n=1 Tax=Coleofasciculus chthonoplastes PCC 7420 TaxID=118168 RepID=B4VXZ2_9CYAN|nr:hypothetical protein [Coleofasciculus chthonoplastes]EDX73260.1 hypothetical protein MC7420_4507 [Coleofasciculus chthonoplastes PCC 7420]
MTIYQRSGKNDEICNRSWANQDRNLDNDTVLENTINCRKMPKKLPKTESANQKRSISAQIQLV